MSDENEQKSFVIKDKRRFDMDGNEKNESETKTENATNDFVVKESPQQEDAINFTSFVVSLATQALMQMGAMEPPAGMSLDKDTEGAKQTIDIIALLKDKTKGNLDDAEKKMIEEILHSLRMNFIEATKK